MAPKGPLSTFESVALPQLGAKMRVSVNDGFQFHFYPPLCCCLCTVQPHPHWRTHLPHPLSQVLVPTTPQQRRNRLSCPSSPLPLTFSNRVGWVSCWSRCTLHHQLHGFPKNWAEAGCCCTVLWGSPQWTTYCSNCCRGLDVFHWGAPAVKPGIQYMQIIC